ncbi:MAG TPA: hypothetical protein VL461_02175 [Dictyobacter sp.]|jgi:hypothetical protein|nr:hypothetical protein [Dictyobacter sp.]
MEQTAKKQSFLSRRWGTIVGIIVIILAVIGVLRSGPHDPEYSPLFGAPATPAVVTTNAIASTSFQHNIVYHGVAISFTKAVLASSFSDDIKDGGPYTVRVYLNTNNQTQGPVGVQYASLAKLILPDGRSVAAQYVSINAVELPGQPQSGGIDFPLSEQVDIAALKLQFGTQTIPLQA